MHTFHEEFSDPQEIIVQFVQNSLQELYDALVNLKGRYEKDPHDKSIAPQVIALKPKFNKLTEALSRLSYKHTVMPLFTIKTLLLLGVSDFLEGNPSKAVKCKQQVQSGLRAESHRVAYQAASAEVKLFEACEKLLA